MKTVGILFTLICCLTCALPVRGQTEAGSSDLNFHGGFVNLSTGADLEFLIGFRYSYHIDEENNIEGTLGYMFPENLRIWLYHLNYRFNLPLREGKVSPFLTAGIGAVTFNFDESLPSSVRAADGTSFTGNFGAGLHIFTHEDLAVRFDFRDIIMFFGEKTVGIQTFDIGTKHNIEVSGGVSFFFE